ncbi:prephenate dehydratase [Gracilibacillus ureilyticus]|uniref:Prephenate dehydratase n=1 Tax=Gracilibacillus ureilyticus TaxID=531814 RepID=A0A1H9RP01_9BACI|nr:prephenate dehydratase [Gracilibacillus ureilyticus]SER74404.1 prephenate dehydratase [Gracilibacillus ureilyticus]
MSETIGYLGPKGTFTKIAVDAMFNGEVKKGYKNIPESIDAVQNGEIDYAVVPLENTIEGTVNVTLDYLIQADRVKIVSEVIVPIRQHLMVHSNNKTQPLEELDVIYSHPHAIAQCHAFLRKQLPAVKAQTMTSTAAAAEYVSNHPEEKVAAIANHLAAKEYNLDIVKKDIHDFDNNHTRFVVLHKDDTALTSNKLEEKGYKTSITVSLPSDRPGALHQVLSAFAWRNLNLSKIESRPMKTGLGNYYFFIDIEQKMDDVLIPNAIAEMESLGCSVSVLGSYPYYLHSGNGVTLAV